MKLPVLRKTRKDRKPAVDNYTLAQHKENKVVATLSNSTKRTSSTHLARLRRPYRQASSAFGNCPRLSRPTR